MESITLGVLSGVGQTFLIALVGVVGRVTGVIGDDSLRHLTRITIAILLPCFLFEALVREFSWGEAGSYGLMLGCGVGLLAGGIALAWAGSRALALGPRDRCTAMALCGFNNSVNIPIPLALALPLAAADAQTLVVLFTLYNLLWGALIWSLGVWLLEPHGAGVRGQWRTIFNPPTVAILLGIVAASPGPRAIVGHTALDPVHAGLTWVGEAAIPISLIILGGILGGLARRLHSVRWRVVGLTAVVKMGLIPALALAAAHTVSPLAGIMALALMIQAASPPATNLIIIAEHFGGDTDTVGATLFVTYAMSALTFVLWLSLPLP